MNYYLEHLLKEFEIPLKNPVLIFSLILFIILLSPIVLKKLKIPGIVGLIISGVIIGPHGFQVLSSNASITLFSTIGLLYIMFIAGLELELSDFKENKNKSLVFGFLTFIMPIAAGFPLCYYILDYDLNASLLTASMFATHTLVAYPIVNRLGISKNQAVAVAVGGTILTDTAVLILLAVIVAENQGNLTQEFWIRLAGSLLIFSIIMFVFIPRIAKWFFRKLESEKYAHYIFVLSVVFFSAFLAQVAGVEPIIGAFVAGLALNKLIPSTSALMNRIEFIGNSIFIPFFLISVGMIVDLKVLFNGPTALIVAGSLTVVALAGKWIAAFLTQVIYKFNRNQRRLIFGLSSSHAAATLAIILVGFKAKILDENILNGTIILILVTCVVASLVTEKAGKAIAISEVNGDTNGSKGVEMLNEHILIATADYEKLDLLLEFSGYIKDKKSANPISLLSVVPNNVEAEGNIMKARRKLNDFVFQASASDVKVNPITTIDHNPAGGIARISREIMADLIVLGWPHRIGFLDKLFGEKLTYIMDHTDKNLFVTFFQKPLNTATRLVVISPPFSEREKGFEMWLKKLLRFCQALGLPMIHYGDIRTHQSLGKIIKNNGFRVQVFPRTLPDIDDFLIISRDINPTDLLVFSSARKGSVSHSILMDTMPQKLEKYFEENNKIVIYPQQYAEQGAHDGPEEIYSGTLTKGIETIGKGLENIFKWPKED